MKRVYPLEHNTIFCKKHYQYFDRLETHHIIVKKRWKVFIIAYFTAAFA